jgi:hypothetical protein
MRSGDIDRLNQHRTLTGKKANTAGPRSIQIDFGRSYLRSRRSEVRTAKCDCSVFIPLVTANTPANGQSNQLLLNDHNPSKPLTGPRRTYTEFHPPGTRKINKRRPPYIVPRRSRWNVSPSIGERHEAEPRKRWT